MNRSVGIIGASGLIGSELAKTYQNQGWHVLRISRRPRKIVNENWSSLNKESLAGLDVLINVAGEAINKRWTASNKDHFYKSRVGLTQQLSVWISELPADQRPTTWINASAVGIYGNRGDDILTEQSPHGSDYLAQLCQEWEAATHHRPLADCRIIHARIGVVFGRKAQAWEKMKVPFSLGLGGKLGNGKQWFPWVHLNDVVNSLIFLSESSTATGPFNIVAPELVTNQQFTKTLGKVLHRPTLLWVPRFILRLMLGEFSSALLASHRVTPDKLEKSGYRWNYRKLKTALRDLR